ncbi:MAG TPA: 1-acyl-sn-glycerol-3-phosphate acyltransferase [Candidatus Dormibacteraeota bacterium]|nr:1-acyl-sn-glycerol-3-phosphate acyltransferase [Candidatus Dormibacteraeota bacterium]
MATADEALPAADLLPVGPKANIPYRIVRLFAVPIMRLAFDIEVHGAENIPQKRGPNYIVIANHLNWPDEFLLLLLFPIEPRLHFLADPTLLVTRKFQWFVVRHSGGYVPVVKSRHGDRRLYEHVDRCLEIGGAIAIFPEGQYGPAEGELVPFHRGFAHFAIRAGVPVVPVGLSGTKDVWFRKKLTVFVGAPIPTAGQDPVRLTKLAYERMRQLVPPYTEPGGPKLLRRYLTHLF